MFFYVNLSRIDNGICRTFLSELCPNLVSRFCCLFPPPSFFLIFSSSPQQSTPSLGYILWIIPIICWYATIYINYFPVSMKVYIDQWHRRVWKIYDDNQKFIPAAHLCFIHCSHETVSCFFYCLCLWLFRCGVEYLHSFNAHSFITMPGE